MPPITANRGSRSPNTRLALLPAVLQEAIRQLQLCTTVDNEELQRLGVKLELDERTGKLRVTRRAGSSAAVGGPALEG
jgi:hypothetical protein